MPINRPRRIFRSAASPISLRSLSVVLAATVLTAGGIALTRSPWLAPGSAARPAAQAADVLAAPPAQVAVVDAGTLRLKDSVVRLLGVEPPARGATCRTVGGSEFDCAAAATNALAAMVREASVACSLHGHDQVGRALAVCQASGTELNQAVIAAGWARADRTQPALENDETAARTARRGLWGAQGVSW